MTEMPYSAASPGSPRRTVANTHLLLVLLCAVQFIDSFDIASMAPALPKIQHDLGMTPNTLQWVVTAYVLGYGGLLLLGGRLADLFNRKRLLIIALVIFTIASVVGGVATTGDMLIGARLAKGITAAFTAPASLAVLLHTYDDEDERNKALGTYGSIAAIGFVFGLVLGGLLSSVTWRLVLFVPAALALLVSIMGAYVIPGADHRTGAGRQPVDVVGAVTVTVALLALVFGVSRASTSGWGDGLVVASLVVAFVLTIVFLLVERLVKSPLVPLGIFARPGLAPANSVAFLFQGSYVAWQFLATLYLQNLQHWAPVYVGLVMSPGGIIMMFTARRWAGYVGKVGAWRLNSVGILLIGLGYLWTLLAFGHVSAALLFVLAQVILGTGYSISYPASNITAVSGARMNEQGLASGLFFAAFQVGSGVILGIVASVYTAHTNAHYSLAGFRPAFTAVVAVGALALLICLVQAARAPRTGIAQPVQPEAVPPGGEEAQAEWERAGRRSG
ncbi:MAG: MFS transporter [Streptosporangiaceae bacterium]|nr:MFS transporter [Streptosporangiaceae bacterium]